MRLEIKINRSYLSIKQNTYICLGTPGFASVYGPDPDAAVVSGAAMRNLVGLETAAMEKSGLPIAVCFGAA